MHGPRAVILLLFVVAMALGGAPSVAAQDATAEATPGGPSEGYPIAIHEGTCDSPGAEPAWQLDDAVSVGVDEDEPEVLGSEAIRNVTQASGAIDVTLDDLGGSDYIVAVHASPDAFGTLAACGQVAGIKEDGKLIVALIAVGDAAVYGIAILDQDDAGVLELGDDQTYLTVYVIPPSNDEEATPAA
jgi:hypothetical protein